MKKNIALLILLLFGFSLSAFSKDITINDRKLNYDIDRLKFSENGIILSPDEVGSIFSDYEIILISHFDKNKKYTIKNSPFKSKKILLLNDTKRTFHNFYIYPSSSRNTFDESDEIKSLITIYGKKNVRLKHEGGDEFEIVVK